MRSVSVGKAAPPRQPKRRKKVTKHLIRGVSFYSSTGRKLPDRQIEAINEQARKVPRKLWNQMVDSGMKIIIQDFSDPGIHPLMHEYLDAIGIPTESHSDIAEKNVAFMVKYGSQQIPVAIVGWGKKRVNLSNEPFGKVLLHETGHLVDDKLEAMKVIGVATAVLTKQGWNQAAIKQIGQINTQPMETSLPNRKTVSLTPEFQQASSGYSPSWGKHGVSQQTKSIGEDFWQYERFAESFADYFYNPRTRKKVPRKLSMFFQSLENY